MIKAERKFYLIWIEFFKIFQKMSVSNDPIKKDPENEQTTILKQKLADMRQDLGDQNLNFLSEFAITIKESPKIESADNDVLRDNAFKNSTIEGILIAEKFMDANSIPYLPSAKEINDIKVVEKPQGAGTQIPHFPNPDPKAHQAKTQTLQKKAAGKEKQKQI